MRNVICSCHPWGCLELLLARRSAHAAFGLQIAADFPCLHSFKTVMATFLRRIRFAYLACEISSPEVNTRRVMPLMRRDMSRDAQRDMLLMRRDMSRDAQRDMLLPQRDMPLMRRDMLRLA